jgi:hypothetical protein
MSDDHDQFTREPLSSPSGAPSVRRSAEPRRPTRETLVRTLLVVLALGVVMMTLLPRTGLPLPSALAHLFTPVPSPIPRPGHFVAGSWERVRLPPVSNAAPPVPAADDPSTLYACASGGAPDANGRMTAGPITLSITHTAGQTWTQVTPTLPSGVSCAVTLAPEGPLILTIYTFASSDETQVCARSRFFLSGDGGATWAEVRHTVLTPTSARYSYCDLWLTARHLYLSTYSQLTVQAENQTMLERSDDGGHTWTRSDVGLPAHGFDITVTGNDSLAALPFNIPSATAVSTGVWMSADAGGSWRRTGTIPERYTGQFLTGFSANPTHPACACFFVAGADNASPHQLSLHLYTSNDGTRWMPLPPLPAPGANQAHTGLFLVVGLTVDGRLLALGADPAAGVLGDVGNTQPALWAWNSRVRQWEVAAARGPCARLDTCFHFSPGLSRGLGPDGATAGTWAWLGQSGSDLPYELDRIFVPAQ